MPDSATTEPAEQDAVCQPLGIGPCFGFGDRIGLATPGHVQAMQQAGSAFNAVFAQQSIREMTRTRRSAKQVLQEAVRSALASGWERPIGADADHLKSPGDIDITVAAGYSFFTIDPSDHIDYAADTDDATTLQTKRKQLGELAVPFNAYRGRAVTLPNGTQIAFDEATCLRITVKYGRALETILRLADHIKLASAAVGRDFEIEVSIDETRQPTTLAKHFILAEQCLNAGVKLVSLAPRFPGNLEKGVDAVGDQTELLQAIRDHAAIAKLLGPYKLSLHAGSDKLSIYPELARATAGCFHVKTAGTSYLEALRVVARHNESLFRTIIEFSRQRYKRDRHGYRMSATVEQTPHPDDIADMVTLEREYLGDWKEVAPGRGLTNPGRQILHCTFGSTLSHGDFGPEIRSILQTHADVYTEVLATHFTRHLQALTAGLE